MSQKIWVTGDAVVDLIPDGENHYYAVPVAPLQMWQLVSRV